MANCTGGLCQVPRTFDEWLGKRSIAGIQGGALASYEAYCAAFAGVRVIDGGSGCAGDTRVAFAGRDGVVGCECGRSFTVLPSGSGRFGLYDSVGRGTGFVEADSVHEDGGKSSTNVQGSVRDTTQSGGVGVRSGVDGRVRVDGLRGGTGTSVVVSTLPRGPNFLRNHENRLRKKMVKEQARQAKLNDGEKRGFFSGCAEPVQVELRESRARLLILENERRAIEEKRKISRLKSSVQVVEDAMAYVRLAESASKLAGDSRVAGWAAAIYEARSESVAKTAPSSVPSLESIGSVGSAQSARVRGVRSRSEKKKPKDVGQDVVAAAFKMHAIGSDYSFDKLPPNVVERIAVDDGVLTVEQLVKARARAGRRMEMRDFDSSTCPYKLSASTRMYIAGMSGSH